MNYGVKLVTAATEEPVTTAEAKTHLAVDDSYYDSFIGDLITAARSQIEDLTNLQMVTATYDLYLDRFPAGREALNIPKGHLQSVTSITYVDTAGASQTLAGSDYSVITSRSVGFVEPVYEKTWPIARKQSDAVTVRFVAGYGAAADVPQGLKQAILLLVGSMFENREGTQAGPAGVVPVAVKSLVNQFSLGDSYTWYGPDN